MRCVITRLTETPGIPVDAMTHAVYVKGIDLETEVNAFTNEIVEIVYSEIKELLYYAHC